VKKPDKKTLHDLLAERTQFRIPTYQRAYDWKHDRQVTDLFDDVVASLEAEEAKELFLGTSILEEMPERNGKTKIVEIIDGQQRITTIFIFLVALRTYAKEYFDSELVDHIQEKIQIESPFRNRAQKNRLSPSDTIENIFEVISKKDWDGEFPSKVEVNGKPKGVVFEVRRVKPVFDTLRNMIHNYCNGRVEKFEDLFEQLIFNTFFIIIEIEDRIEAFEIFERTNARGKSLEVSDLLKNYLFSKENKMDGTSAEKVWEDISEKAGNNLLRMLKYYWVSKHGYIAKRDLYTKLRRYADKIGINQFTEELLSFAKFFKAYNSDERGDFKRWLKDNDLAKGSASQKSELVRIRNAFRLFKVTQVIPLIYSSSMALNRTEDIKGRKSKSYISLLRFIEFYHLSNNKISIRVGNEVEKLYAEFCARFDKEKDFSTVCQQLRQLLDKKLAKTDEFKAGFSNLSYKDVSDKHLIRYIFDQLANSAVHTEQRIPIFDYFDILAGDDPSYNIDHILSQKEGDNKVEPEVLHDIGNLIVMPKQMNSAFQSSPFSKKIELLQKWHQYDKKIAHPPKYLIEFANNYKNQTKWTKEDIINRKSELAVLVYTKLKAGVKY